MVNAEKENEEMTVRASIFKTGDIILMPGNFPPFWPFYLIMKPFVRGYGHIFMIYGENGRGKLLAIESTHKCGPTISLLKRYAGKKIEVYRIDHPFADIFNWAILAAGDEIIKRCAFYDYLLVLPRAILAYLGFSGRISNKYYPLYLCSDFLQVCIENAPKFIEEAAVALGKSPGDCRVIADIYKKDVLDKFPKARRSKDNRIRLMAPIDFKELPFLKFIEKGKLEYKRK